ncbi:MAG TPA: CocE/NonD family hydrolase [Streptosporangiaceae bacterium]|nr:CocE/NonD family hydrolase [Streptosporangiaceae bacterium]
MTKPDRGTPAVSRILSRAWSLPPRRNQVAVERGVKVPMSDGTVLLADHYIPVSVASAATVLVRCPYGRGFPFSVGSAQVIAEHGYHVLLQSVRGTFGSGGDFEPMRNEIADGQDTVAWLRKQDWFTGRLATFGASYLGFVQWALAMDPPPELAAAVVQVGPHDFSRTAYRNGVFDLYNFLSWADLIAHQEHTGLLQGGLRNATAPRRLRPALATLPVRAGARELLGTQAPWFESWLEHPRLNDPFWAPLQCGAALERTAVPTLLIGGWHDLFIEQTLEQYRTLAARGVPARLLVGPWTHLEAATSGTAIAESLAWLDRYVGTGTRRAGDANGAPAGSAAGPGRTPEGAERSVRVWVGGTPEAPRTSRIPQAPGRAGQWRDLADWPPAGTGQQRWSLGPDGTLSPREPAAGQDDVARFRYDPADPTPSVGGAILAAGAGARDNRAVERRPDVLVFSSGPLDRPVEIIGEVAAELSVTRDNPNADLFVRLCDVSPRGRSRNVCDGIVRLTGQDPLTDHVTVSLVGAAHRFDRGHQLRLQVSGGAFPRFARNPGNGEVDPPAADLAPTEYEIGLGGRDTANASVLLLPVNQA